MAQGIPAGGISPTFPTPALPELAPLQARSVRTRLIAPTQLRDPGAVLDAVGEARARQQAAQTPVGTLSQLTEGSVAEWLTMTAKLIQGGRGMMPNAIAMPLRTSTLPTPNPVDFSPNDRLAGRPMPR